MPRQHRRTQKYDHVPNDEWERAEAIVRNGSLVVPGAVSKGLLDYRCAVRLDGGACDAYSTDTQCANAWRGGGVYI